MRRAFMVLAVALIALPIFAEQKKPTVTPTPPARETQRLKKLDMRATGRVVKPTMTPTLSEERTTTINNSKSNNLKVAGTVTPTAGPLEVDPHGATINGSKSNNYRVGGADANVTVTPISAGEKTTTVNGTKSNSYKVVEPNICSPCKVISISVESNTFIVLANGKEVTFSGAKLKALPKVGETVDISYTQTSGGPLEVVKIKSTKSNASE